jgi:Ni/Fe-hydrogenase b-type cytochrome subunit
MTRTVDQMTPEERGAISLKHPVPPPEGNYRWVYLWHWPIRAMHWIAAISILLLVLTGFYIQRPYFITGSEEVPRFVMGWMRLTHFIAAAALVATGIVRLYWLFAGNRYERWKALFPVRGRDWRNLWRMVKYYLMIDTEHAPHYLGHHPMQQFTYTLVYVVTAIMAVTGFALYGQSNPGGLIDSVFGWVNVLFGGSQIVRFIHHVLTWFYLIFIPLHVYLSIRADRLEKTGTVSSIISGGRWVPTDHEYEDA